MRYLNNFSRGHNKMLKFKGSVKNYPNVAYLRNTYTTKLKLCVGGSGTRWMLWEDGRKDFIFDLFCRWWDHFKLEGTGLIVGEKGIRLNRIKEMMKTKYPNIDTILGLDLSDSDINIDMCKVGYKLNYFNWVFSQATLEHLVDPVRAVGYMVDSIIDNGMIFLHSVGPLYGYHRYPIDCYRFFPDAIYGFCDLYNIKVEDFASNSQHWFLAGRVQK
jgi:hypothetical protein